MPSALLAEDAKSPAPEAAKTEAAKTEKAKSEEAADPAKTPAMQSDIAALWADTNLMWLVIAAMLVFAMQLGFAFVEAGLCRAKNCCNILLKNLMDFCIGAILFFLTGYGLMFGASNGWFGTSDFLYGNAGDVGNTLGPTYSGWGFWFFQCVFCATAATIISGAVAERIKFHAYLVYTVVITGLIYPIYGGWVWGSSNFLFANHYFHDFAGSTVVHSVGGWAALAGAIALGPRIGKYGKDGKVKPIPGHSMPMVCLGVFILWLGWYGFNPGSTLVAQGGHFARVAVTTTLAACAGAITAMITAWVWFKKPDFGMIFSGVLAGLVAITAPCAVVTPVSALIIGGIGGVLVVVGIYALDVVKIDDPVSAVPVHLMNGIWGTLSVGIFANQDYVTKMALPGTPTVMGQLKGIGMAAIWVFPLSLILFYGLKFTIGLRVSETEEMEGLDIHEHGNEAYAGDVIAGVSLPTTGAKVASAVPMTKLAEGGAD
ncbi:MAG: ammonium transporter [Planctomycetota bacterium]|nr:ammonium transporter [Planctomycetota bacterium]